MEASESVSTPSGNEEQQQTETQETSANQDYVEDLRQLLAAATHPRSKTLLQRAVEEAERESLDNGVGEGQRVGGGEPEELKSSSAPSSQSPPIVKPARSVPLTYSTRISQYGWDQTPRVIKIYITGIDDLPKVSKDAVHSEFTKNSLSVEVKGPNGKMYSLVINDLFESIVPENSTAKLKSGTVIVTLRKSNEKEWPFLTGREKRLKDAREPKTPKMDKDEDPGSSLMSLMKQMYQDGDDDMKRTIAKAWHDSQEKRSKEQQASEI